jgi:hypothetical protein
MIVATKPTVKLDASKLALRERLEVNSNLAFAQGVQFVRQVDFPARKHQKGCLDTSALHTESKCHL